MLELSNKQGDDGIMRAGGPMIGAVAGLAIALLLVGVASALGPGASHIALVHPPNVVAQSASGGQASMDVTTAMSATAQPNASPGSPLSHIGALSGEPTGTLGLVLLPILLGSLVGALCYGILSRRADAD
jgi:hypothetical protein